MKRDVVLILLALTIATFMAVRLFSPEETVERKSIESKSIETEDSQIEEKLEGQKRQLETIEKNAARKRQEISQYYNRRHAEIRSDAAGASMSAKAEDRTAWANFQEKLNNTTSFTESISTTTGYIAPSGNFSASGSHVERTDTYVRGNPSQEYAVKRRQTAEVRNGTLTSCELDLVQLQRQTQYELDQVDKWEKRMKSHVSSAISSIIAKPKSETLGLIKGIVSSEDGYGAMIGIEFVREGDTIGDITIIKIDKDKVEFEKNGKRWTQGLNEPPGPQWQ